MNDQFRISSLLAARLTEHKLALPVLLRLAGLPPGFFQREKVYATTAELFALWRAIGEMSPDPGIGLKLGAEPRFSAPFTYGKALRLGTGARGIALPRPGCWDV